MGLEGKVAVVFGAGGSMGGAIACAFGEAGAGVVLAGRTLGPLETVAEAIRAGGGLAETGVVDVDDAEAVKRYVDELVGRNGRVDVSCNAVGMDDVQNIPLVDLALDDFMISIDQAMRRHFVTATVAARQMSTQGSGAIVMLTASAAREWRHVMGGFSIACGAIETFARTLAAEVGKDGVRVVCIRANFTPETYPGVTEADIRPLVDDTMIGRLPRLAEVGAAAAYAASDSAGATTGVVLDLTCGAIVD